MRKATLSLISLATVVALTVSCVGLVFANDTVEQSAEQDQTLKVECTSGAYGQDSNCKAEGTQSQKLHQIITYSKVLGTSKIHTPVNTSVDPAVMAVVLATGLTGIGAFIGYIRLS